jgi:hypothetical protein
MAKETTKYRPGYEWYPDQWKSSNTFLDIDDPLLRYFYREVIDLLYLNKGVWEANRKRFEKSQRYNLSDQQWADLKGLFNLKILPSGSEIWSHKSVDKRIDMRVFTSAENGKKGGAQGEQIEPLTNLNPNKEISPDRGANEPISTKNGREVNRTKPNVSEGLVSGISTSNGSKTPSPPPQPLWAVGLRDGLVVQEVWKKYGEFLREKLPGMDRDRMEKAWFNFQPFELLPDRAEKLREILADLTDVQLKRGLGVIAESLEQVGKSGTDCNAYRETLMQPITHAMFIRRQP